MSEARFSFSDIANEGKKELSHQGLFFLSVPFINSLALTVFLRKKFSLTFFLFFSEEIWFCCTWHLEQFTLWFERTKERRKSREARILPRSYTFIVVTDFFFPGSFVGVLFDLTFIRDFFFIVLSLYLLFSFSLSLVFSYSSRAREGKAFLFFFTHDITGRGRTRNGKSLHAIAVRERKTRKREKSREEVRKSVREKEIEWTFEVSERIVNLFFSLAP